MRLGQLVRGVLQLTRKHDGRLHEASSTGSTSCSSSTSSGSGKTHGCSRSSRSGRKVIVTRGQVLQTLEPDPDNKNDQGRRRNSDENAENARHVLHTAKYWWFRR